MAKRTKKTTTTTTTTSNYSLVKFCAFVGLIVAAIAGIVSFILWLLLKIDVTIGWGNKIVSICNLVSRIALFITVWLAAWDYVKHKGKSWRMLYLILLVLSILSFFGLFYF